MISSWKKPFSCRKKVKKKKLAFRVNEKSLNPLENWREKLNKEYIDKKTFKTNNKDKEKNQQINQ